MILTYLAISVFGLIILYFFLKFFFSKKKKQTNEIPKHWHVLLHDKVLFYKKLNKEEQLCFREQVQFFFNKINIESVGFELEELDELLVASSAVIPVFNFKNWSYSNIKTVLIYPDYFNEDLQFDIEATNKTIGGLIGNGRFENQMILSRKALHHGFLNKTDKGNTGIHEFIHLLDKLDGTVDGIPKVLLANENVLPWLELIHKKIEAINKDSSDIRSYGGTSKEEFFAVASEYFFERPMLLKRKHPELFRMLSDCFKKV